MSSADWVTSWLGPPVELGSKQNCGGGVSGLGCFPWAPSNRSTSEERTRLIYS